MNISTGWAAETSIPVTFASTASFNFNLSVLKTNLPDDEALKNSAINFVICKTGTGLSRVNMTAQVTLPPVKNIVVTNTTPAADSSTFEGETCANCKTLKTRVQTLEEKVQKLEEGTGLRSLRFLRSRQLVEAGRWFYWKKYEDRYSSAHPEEIDREEIYMYRKGKVVETNPKQWGNFIEFAALQSCNGTFWHILAGGKRSKYGTLSESIHHADMYEIALLCGEMAPEYEELFAEVFELTVTAAIEIDTSTIYHIQ